MEFLIIRTDGDWFDLPPESGCEIYFPEGYEARIVEAPGYCRIAVAGCVLSFSFEMSGIQVTFEQGPAGADEGTRIVDAIRKTIEKGTGQKGEVIQIA